MGYYVKITKARATMPSENVAEALKRLHELNKRDDLKTGGSFGPNGTTDERWFAWMPANYDQTTESAAQILEMVGYEVEKFVDESFSILDYDSKTGCEATFIWAIADLFAPGSFIEWKGEELGHEYRWEFGGGQRMIEREVMSVVWTEGVEFEPRTSWF